MHRIDQPTAVSSLPTPAAAGTPGYFSNATPGSGTPTIIDNDWCNDIQEELIAILTAASVAPSKTTHNQVLTSLQSLFAAKGVVGAIRNGKMSITTAGTSGTFTADEIIVEVSLGGAQNQLSSYSQTINLATTGAGGMDTGSAPTSGYVALYAIYGSSGASILATNVSSASAPSIYAGSHMPTGYTSSALIGIWPTNGSNQFVAGFQLDRQFTYAANVTVLSSGGATSWTSISLATAAPQSAKTASLWALTSSNSGQALGISPFSSGPYYLAGGAYSGSTNVGNAFSGTMPILTSQTIYYNVGGQGTGSWYIYITGYGF